MYIWKSTIETVSIDLIGDISNVQIQRAHESLPPTMLVTLRAQTVHTSIVQIACKQWIGLTGKFI